MSAYSRHLCEVHERGIATAATGISPGKMLNMLVSFWSLSVVERTHPLEGGYGRIKVRTDRRPGLPIVPAWRFWPVYGRQLSSR